LWLRCAVNAAFVDQPIWISSHDRGQHIAAVAHYGRGRGDWKESEYPSFWRERVEAADMAHRATLTTLWTMRGRACEPPGMEPVLQKELGAIARAAGRPLSGRGCS
jgi:hypothetical protein